jgi:hypothetical protein
MSDRWVIHGTEFENCNCAPGCPCQFGAKSTQGHCEAFMCGHIDKGNFNDTNLDGLDWAMVMYWPGEVHEGNGTQQVIIDQRADPTQREALRKILHGESTTPGKTHFFVYNSMMSAVLDTLYAPIEMSISEWPASRSKGWSSHAGRRSAGRRTQHCRAEYGSVPRTGRAISIPRWAAEIPQPARESNLT